MIQEDGIQVGFPILCVAPLVPKSGVNTRIFGEAKEELRLGEMFFHCVQVCFTGLIRYLALLCQTSRHSGTGGEWVT